jgi:hypothetical protein
MPAVERCLACEAEGVATCVAAIAEQGTLVGRQNTPWFRPNRPRERGNAPRCPLARALGATPPVAIPSPDERSSSLRGLATTALQG